MDRCYREYRFLRRIFLPRPLPLQAYGGGMGSYGEGHMHPILFFPLGNRNIQCCQRFLHSLHSNADAFQPEHVACTPTATGLYLWAWSIVSCLIPRQVRLALLAVVLADIVPGFIVLASLALCAWWLRTSPPQTRTNFMQAQSRCIGRMLTLPYLHQTSGFANVP